MFVTAFGVALIVTAVLALLFIPLLTRRWRGDREGLARGEGWAALLFFVLVFLASWAGGLWVRPVGPVFWGVSWLGFVLVGLAMALLLTSLSPYHGGRTPAGPRAFEAAPLRVWSGSGAAFWLLVALLIAAIATGAIGA